MLGDTRLRANQPILSVEQAPPVGLFRRRAFIDTLSSPIVSCPLLPVELPTMLDRFSRLPLPSETPLLEENLLVSENPRWDFRVYCNEMLDSASEGQNADTIIALCAGCQDHESVQISPSKSRRIQSTEYRIQSTTITHKDLPNKIRVHCRLEVF